MEDELLKDKAFQHILKFAPQSQRELMTFELARYFDHHITAARIEGAKDYNRILTNKLGNHEYTPIDGVVGVYRQSVVGEAVRDANKQTIQLRHQYKPSKGGD